MKQCSGLVRLNRFGVFFFLLFGALAPSFAQAQTELFFPFPHGAFSNGLESVGSALSAHPFRLFPIGPEKAGLTLKSSADLPLLMPDGDADSLRLALKRQVERCQKQNLNTAWYFGLRLVTRKEWCVETNEFLLKLLDEENSNMDRFWKRAQEELEWYESLGNDNQGAVLFTGYYIPRLRGSRVKSTTYSYPLYNLPSELVRIQENGRHVWRKKNGDGSLEKFFTRKEIDWGGALDGRGLEIAYIDDPVEGYFLHVQGSGALIVEEKDGTKKRVMVNYAGQNGHPYISMAQELVKEGLPRQYWTLQGLRRYFKENPGEAARAFPWNPSYIFFQESADGPYGAASTVLVPGHSIAVDYSVFPMGLFTFFKVKRPEEVPGETDPQKVPWFEFSRLALTQDTGGAIRGPGRVDVYWGEGDYAETAAGGLHHDGNLFFGILKKKN